MREEVPNINQSECNKIDEQRLSVVLDLYYKNSGRKREGKEKGERGGLERKRVRGREKMIRENRESGGESEV